MNAFVAAGAGFLLAVLWFDLMFDTLLAGAAGSEPSAGTIDSIAAYYRRVTTTSRPMNRLVATAMLGTLAAIVLELTGGYHPSWLGWVSLPLALAPIAIAGGRTVPQAVRLGGQADPPPEQAALARAIFREHLFCFAAIGLLLALQLCFG